MFNRLFVSHLEGKGFLTPQQAIEVLRAQKDTKVKIGVLAVEENLITPEQAEAINRMQATQNARFGEIAISNGYLSQEQLDFLLDLQPRDYIILKQILHDKKYITAEALDNTLAEFKDELGLSAAEFNRLLDNHVDTYVSKIANIDLRENILLTVFARVFIKTAIRLVDKEIMVGKAVKVSNNNVPFAISLKLVGDVSEALVFSAGEVASAIEFAGKFAEGFMGTTIDANDEISQDAMKEFLNCIGGLFTTEVTSKTHLKLDIEVPVFNNELPVEREIIALPFSLDSEGFKIFIY